MTFADRITRTPRPHDAERGHELASEFAQLAADMREVIAGAGASSPYLYSLIPHETDWLVAALAGEPEAAFEAILAEVQGLAVKELPDGLRRAKRRVALLCGLADLGGVWQLHEVTEALSRFADLAVDRCIKSLVAAEIDRGKLPGMGEADKATAAGMCVLAMGKMGAGELNYSSDIDLICLFDETRFAPDDYADARAAFIRVTRRMCAMLSDLTGEGYVFRTDLRLRPDPSVTPVCLSMEAAERYYESVGRTWERAAHIKARPCAGDIEAGWRYLKTLRPFIWRKHLDFAAIQDAHDMRLRIRDHKGLHGPIVLEGHNMKLGAGGIREIEFFTQTRQIIAGGRDEDLRARGTLAGLAGLAEKGWVPGDVARQLSEDYMSHREVEHRLQMINDAQTHDLPKTDEGFARLAALSGRGVAEMRADLQTRLERVAQLTEGFFAPQSSAPVLVELTPVMAATVERWRSYPSLRSARAVEIFARLKPEILNRLQTASNPEQALLYFDGFLAGLPGGVQVFSLFEANPQLIDLIVDIAATAPQLARYLGRNAQVFDAVIGGDFFADWPGGEALLVMFTGEISAVEGYETQLDTARRLMKEWHFRIGVHHLRGLIEAPVAGAQYAALAGAVLGAIWPVVAVEFAAKHGDAPGRGAAVLGMGSLGAGRLTASSDLDLIVIYDAHGVEASEGRRPLATRPYYARLTQALVTALSAQMAEGRLYEVDMRLRPSGRQGPVATSLQAFKSYQLNEAWTWEHLALTRARFVAGEAGLGRQLSDFRLEVLGLDRKPALVLRDVSEMRARIAETKPGSGPWEAKLGVGHLQDIELLAQTAALLAGKDARDVAGQLAGGVDIGFISQDECDGLLAAYGLLWSLQSVGKLLGSDAEKLSDMGQGALEFLLRETGAGDAAALSGQIEGLAAAAGAVIAAALGRVDLLP